MPRVVVVDDNPTICDNLRFLLESEGFEVAAFLDPVEALRFCRQQGCEMLVSDVRMPGLDGFALVEAVRRARPAVRTIMISSHFDDEEPMAQAVMSRTCDVALTKPYSLQAMLRSVLRLMAAEPLASAA